jgi:diadenosine tetraphosphate (Ap4A) HIT family hydrolase
MIPKNAVTCDFCNPDTGRIILRDKRAYAMLSLWPVSEYHTLIIPERHVESEAELTSEEVLAISKLKLDVIKLVNEITPRQDYNFGIDVGATAGGRIPHIHYHLIFRKPGDTPAPRGIRSVIPETASYESDDDPRLEWVLEWAQDLRDIAKAPNP